MVVCAPGGTITIDVKAVAGPVDWLVGSTAGPPRDKHFVVLLTDDGKVGKVDALPRAWVLPRKEFLALVRKVKDPSTMKYVSRSEVRTLENRANAWHLLGSQSAQR